MEIAFQLTSKDYWKTLRYQLRRASGFSPLRFLPACWAGLYGALLGLGGMLLYRRASLFGCLDDRLFVLGVLLFLAGVVALGLSPYIRAFFYRRILFLENGYYCSPQTLRVADDCLVHRCSDTESKIAWSDVLGVEDDADYLYVFLDFGLAIPVPRRAFSDRSSYHLFMASLSGHVPKQG